MQTQTEYAQEILNKARELEGDPLPLPSSLSFLLYCPITDRTLFCAQGSGLILETIQTPQDLLEAMAEHGGF